MIALLLALGLAQGDAVSGVYKAERVPKSPVLTSAGMAWWKGRLILADRVTRRLLAFTPPDRWSIYADLVHPVGVAVDPDGHLVVTEKEKNVLNQITRYRVDGTEERLVEGEEAGSPHFLAIHDNGTIYWSGFPDGGTRNRSPDGKVTVHTPRIVHTYGIALGPRQEWLYVNSKIPNKDRRGTWRFPVRPDGSLGEGTFFLQVMSLEPKVEGMPPAKDGATSLLGWVGRLQGLAVDRKGYLYIAGAESHHSDASVAVVTPDGKKVAAMILDVPRNISGLAWGGEDRKTLFVTGAGNYRLYQVTLPVAGAVR